MRRAAILGIPAMDTVKEVKRASIPGDVALITATIPRERVVLAQTPQVFAATLLLEAFARAAADGVGASDEAGLVERLGHRVHVVLGSERNLKITKPGDLELAEFYLSQERTAETVGVEPRRHRVRSAPTGTGRPLILGGIEVPFEKGPVGHSDGDALAHAICDALLGAAGLGDIGTHFPDTDPQWKGANSLLFLEHVRGLLAERGLRIAQVDAIVITERPKLGPHFPAMRQALAGALGIGSERINLKAKTNEGVDAVGRGEAIAAQAIATLESSGLRKGIGRRESFASLPSRLRVNRMTAFQAREKRDSSSSRASVRGANGARRSSGLAAHALLRDSSLNGKTHGIHAVREALAAGRPLQTVIVGREHHGDRLEEIVSLARSNGVPVRFEDRAQLDRAAGTREHQGVVAMVAARAAVSLEDLLARKSADGGRLACWCCWTAWKTRKILARSSARRWRRALAASSFRSGARRDSRKQRRGLPPGRWHICRWRE